MARPLKYDETNIKRLKGLEGIRTRPGMYLGELGKEMVFQSAKELIGNSADEAFAGRNSYVFVHADTKNNTYIVADKAEGIPVGLVPEDPEKPKGKKISLLTLIFTEIHTGGKFDDKAYTVSQGTHGVGASATNAVSEVFEVWTHRDRKWYYQKFLKGRPVSPVAAVRLPADLKKVLPYNPVCGTIIRFKPDQSVVSIDGGKTVARLDVAYTARWMRDLAMLNPGLELVLSSGGKTKTYLNKEGLAGIVKQRIAEKELETVGKLFVHNSDSMAIAIQWTDFSEDTGLATYVNSGITRDHGEHEVGFRNALTKALKPFGKKTDKYAPKDLYYGMIGILNYKMSSAAFSGQTKDRLTSNVSGKVEAETLTALSGFFDKNKSLARTIIRRATDAKKSKDEFQKTMKNVTQAKRGARQAMPAGLVQSPKATAATRELYIMEGDSAGSSGKKARDPATQEILKLTGKIANAAKQKLHTLMESRAIRDILTSVGYNFDVHRKSDAEHKLRVNRIILLPDADVDGQHITVLLLTLFQKLMPFLFEEGRIYIVDAPLFSAYYKGARYFGATLQEVSKQLPRGAKCQIMRSKGWGEISHETLAHVAFNRDTRTIAKVVPVKGKELKHFELLVGSDTAARKELLGL